MKTRQCRALRCAAFALTGAIAGQAWADGSAGGGQPGGGIGVGSQAAAGTDVTQIEYVFSRVPCEAGEMFPPLQIVATEELNPGSLPGGIPAFEDNPLASGSEHAFADHFEALPPGCYDVRATPLQADGSPSQDCSWASADAVEVYGEETTEILLIQQCEGYPTGGLDVIVPLNQPPQIEMLDYLPSKFTTVCQGTLVCVFASDPNGDPLELDWRATGLSAPALTISLASRSTIAGVTTECVDVMAKDPGSYEIEVRVYDLLNDPLLGLIRVEQWLANQGNPAPSHAALRFPIHVAP